MIKVFQNCCFQKTIVYNALRTRDNRYCYTQSRIGSISFGLNMINTAHDQLNKNLRFFSFNPCTLVYYIDPARNRYR